MLVASFFRVYNAFCNGRRFLPIIPLIQGAWPVALWMVSFKQVARIPYDWRPAIHLDLLPAWNAFLVSPLCVALLTLAVAPAAHFLFARANSNQGKWRDQTVAKTRLAAAVILFYPALLSLIDFTANSEIAVYKDIIAFAWYGVAHFAWPFLAGFGFWLWAPPGVSATYGWLLGFTNMSCVCTHILFPTGAPWYLDLGNPPPSYATTLGSPAGLIRIDDLFGWNLYHKAFKLSPVVFGALPSVHASSAVCFSLLACRYFNKTGTSLSFFYAAAMFWTTIYLRHHFAIDLLAGTLYATAWFLLFRHTTLQQIDARTEAQGLTTGWERLIHGYGPSKPDLLPLNRYMPLSPIPEELKSPYPHASQQQQQH